MKREEQLREALDNLIRISKQYKDEPELLAIYEPPARQFVKLLIDEWDNNADNS